jgi:hypothetical protein
VAKSVVRERSIGENYERSILRVRSNTSRFSRGIGLHHEYQLEKYVA